MEMKTNVIKAFNIKYFNENENYVIEASAGTGKTYSIVEIVKKITESDINKIKKILIVTYTEKAAGELKDRIAKGLRKKFKKEADKINLNDISIFTIHSFCKTTISEFGITSNLPLNLDLISDLDLYDFSEKYFRTGEVYKTIIGLRELGYEVKYDALKETFIEGVGKYYLDINNNEDTSIVSLEKTAIDYSDSLKKVLAFKTYKDFDDFLNKYKDARTNYDALKNSSVEIARIDAEIIKDTFKNMFYGMKIKKDGSEEGHGKIKNKSPEDVAYGFFKNLQKELGSNNQDLFDGGKFATLVITNAFFKDFFISWQKEKEYKKSQSFDDMIRYIREEVMKDNSELTKKLREKYTYGIIDEFQDTNQKQFDIFKTIFMCEGHHIIVVGDPKQSIYAFQGADVSVYNNAKEEISKVGNLESLKKNWRSSNDMVNFAGKFFHKDNGFDFTITGFEASEVNDNFWSIYKEKDGKTRPSIWVGAKNRQGDAIDKNEFAKIAIEQILESCKKIKKDGDTALVLHYIDDNGDEIKRSVTFSDFTILARTRYEMTAIKSELKKAGIPFTQYKDNTLFYGKECANWISVLSAINLPDFTGYNRKIFKKALFTDFFGKELYELNDEKYEKDDIREIGLFNEWRNLAKKRLWEDLIDSVMVKSDLFTVLKDLNKSQAFNKIKQLGEYIVDYLYDNHTLDDVIRNLHNLSSGDEEDEEGAIVSRGSNFECVKIMTMHASKGLEFPVVISVGGTAGLGKGKGKAFTYHDDNKQLILTLNKDKKSGDIIKNELAEEFKRIYYVAYTRAKYILMIPNYQDEQYGDGLEFLKDATQNFIKNNPSLYTYVTPQNKTYAELKEETQAVLGKKEGATPKEISDQKDAIKELIKKEKQLISVKRSYSSLSHPKHEEDDNPYDDSVDLEGEKGENLSEFDKISIQVDGKYDDNKALIIPAPKKFPKGNKVGSALHEVFEKLDYQDYGKQVDKVIEDAFKKEQISVSAESNDYIKNMVDNVLSAELPEIKGSNATGEYFKLNELKLNEKRAEAEFNFNLIFGNKVEFLKNYFNGFIDLTFQRGEYFSILDWKSDTLKTDDYNHYSNKDDLKEHVNDCYSIQRVLYAYCLIRWLKTYYPDEDYEDIFKNHFGGVYYVFLRGCNSDTSNGVYSHTWSSYSEIEKAYENIINARIWRKA